MEKIDPYKSRRHLTFAQAEGAEKIPTQLRTKQLSAELRALLWEVVHSSMNEDEEAENAWQPGSYAYFRSHWGRVLYSKHVVRDHLMADEFRNDSHRLRSDIKQIFTKGNYVEVFDFLEFVLRHEDCPYNFAAAIDQALLDGHAAYRVLDEHMIVPFASEEDLETLKSAFANTAITEFRGARSHLQLACTHLTAGHYSSAVRESIHAVEAVARTLAPSGTLNDALAKLEKSTGIHGALKKGFTSIYGYTSDEKGIRHPLLESSHSKVDEADAMFMLGACASFVSYMINKARLARLLS